MGDQQISESAGQDVIGIYSALTKQLEDIEREVDDIKETCLSLDRLAEIFFEGQEASRAAQTVISGNPIYSSNFTADDFLHVAVGYAFARAFDIDIELNLPDEILALGDMPKFIEELRYQIKASEEKGVVRVYPK